MSDSVKCTNIFKSLQEGIREPSSNPSIVYEKLLDALYAIKIGSALDLSKNDSQAIDECFLDITKLFQRDIKPVFMPSISQSVAKNGEGYKQLIPVANGNVNIGLRRIVYALSSSMLTDCNPPPSLSFVVLNTLVSEVSKFSSKYADSYHKILASQIDPENFCIDRVSEYLKGEAIKLMRLVTVQSSENEVCPLLFSDTALPQSIERYIEIAFSTDQEKSERICNAVLSTLIMAIHTQESVSLSSSGITYHLKDRLLEQGSVIQRFRNSVENILVDYTSFNEDLVPLAMGISFSIGNFSTHEKAPFTNDALSSKLMSSVISGQSRIFENLCTLDSATKNALNVSYPIAADIESQYQHLPDVALIPVLRVVRKCSDIRRISTNDSHSKGNPKVLNFLYGCVMHDDSSVVLEAAKLIIGEALIRLQEGDSECPKSVTFTVEHLHNLVLLCEEEGIGNEYSYADLFFRITFISSVLKTWNRGIPQHILKDYERFMQRCFPASVESNMLSENDCIVEIIKGDGAILTSLLHMMLLSLPLNPISASDISHAEHILCILKRALCFLTEIRCDFENESSDFFERLVSHAASLMHHNSIYVPLFRDLFLCALSYASHISTKVCLLRHMDSLIDVTIVHSNVDGGNPAICMLNGTIEASASTIDDCSDMESFNVLDSVIRRLASNVKKLALITLKKPTVQMFTDMYAQVSGNETMFQIPNVLYHVSDLINWKPVLHALRSLKRYFSLHADLESKRVTLDALLNIALAFSPHALGDGRTLSISEDICEYLLQIEQDFCQKSYIKIEDRTIFHEVILNKNLLLLWRRLLTQMQSSKRIPSNFDLTLFKTHLRSYLPVEEEKASAPTIYNDTKPSLELNVVHDNRLIALLRRSEVINVTGDIESIDRIAPTIILTENNQIEQDFIVQVTPILAKRYLLLCYEVTNNTSHASSEALPDSNLGVEDVQITAISTNSYEFLSSEAIYTSAIESISAGETAFSVVCFALSRSTRIEHFKEKIRFQNMLKFSAGDNHKGYDPMSDPFDDFLDTQVENSPQISLNDLVLGISSYFRPPSSLSLVNDEAAFKTLSSRWKEMEKPQDIPKGSWEFSKQFTMHSIDSADDAYKWLSSNDAFIVLLDPREHKLKASDGSLRKSGYYTVWMCADFILSNEENSSVILQCRLIFDEQGSVCYVSVRGGNAFIRSEVAEEIFG